MKMKRTWKKVIARVLAAVMLVSVFATVDMGWNVMEVKADESDTLDGTSIRWAYNSSTKTLTLSGTGGFEGWLNGGDQPYGKYSNSVEHIVVENGITKIGRHAFSDFYSVVDIRIGSGCTEIGTFAFSSLNRCTNIVFTGSTVCKVEEDSFYSTRATLVVPAAWKPYSPFQNSNSNLNWGGGTFNYTAPHTHTYSNWSSDGVNHYKLCTNNCPDSDRGKTLSGKHTGGTATCTNKAKCDTCKLEYGGLLNHDLNSKTGQAATCISEGWNDYWQCSVCSKVSATNDQAGVIYNNLDAWKVSDAGKIGKTAHPFIYELKDNVITATCSKNGCSYNTTGVTLDWVAKNATYTGSAYEGVKIDGWSETPNPEGLVNPPTETIYKQGQITLDGAPINVGDYTASIAVEGVTATKSFSITKKHIAAGDLTVTRDDAIYDGTAKAADVALNGVDGTGDITVTYRKKNGDDWGEETDSAPVNAGTYQVVASVSGGVNFEESQAAVKEFVISKAMPSIETTPSFDDTITYGTTLNDIRLDDDGVAEHNGNEIPGTFAWKNGTTKPVVSDSKSVNATDFFIVFTPDDSENYNPCETNVTLTVKKAIHENAPEDGEGYILKYPDETLVADPETDYEVSSTNGDEATPLDNNKVEPGKTYYVRYKANENQESSPWREIKVAPRPDAPNESVVTERTDVSITMQMIPGVEYSIDGTNWFTATDADKNVTVTDGNITFGGLTKETKYIIRSKVKATDSAPHGEETTQEVTTKKALPSTDEDRKALFDITLPTGEDLIYDKETKKAEVKLKDDADTGIGEPVIKYYKKNGDVEVEVKNPTDAGDYIVKVTTLPTDDYPALSPELELGRFTIAKKEITISGIKANDKVYDGDVTATLNYSNVIYNGIVAGDSLTVTATGKFDDANAGESKNVSISSLVLGGASVGNYVLATSGNQSNTIAKISPAVLTEEMVILAKKKIKYTTGDPINITAGDNLIVKFKDNTLSVGTDYELSGNISETAINDSYTLKVAGKGNFTGIVDKNWQITNKEVVPVTDINPIITVTYGETPIINGPDASDKVTYGTKEDSIEETSISYKDAGEYVIWYKVSRDGYEPYEGNAVIKINPKPLSPDDIVWGDESLEYNGKVQARAATVKLESLISGDTCGVITTSTARNVGTGYIATATGLTNKNYKLPETAPTATFSITPKSLTLKARNVSKYVGEKDPTLSYEAVGLCPGDIISGVSVSRNPGEGAGTYLIKVTVDADAVDPDAANKNYTITTQYGSLVISDRPADNEDSNSGSGNNNPVIPVVPVQKPVVLPIDALTANAANKNTKNTTGNNKGANLGADGTNAETDDLSGANGAGNLTIHLEVSEHSPIETASIETPVTKLLEGSDVFTTEEALAIKGGVDARVWVHIDKLDMSVVPDSVHDEILSAAKGLEDDNVELLYFDISLFKQIGDGEIVNIHEPGTHIDITLELPESVINTDDKVVREYKILRLHDGVIDVIPTTYNPDTQTISFATDKFSTYVLAYIDKSAEEVTEADNTDSITVNEVEKENSSTAIYIILFILLILAIAIIIFILYRRKKNEDTI